MFSFLGLSVVLWWHWLTSFRQNIKLPRSKVRPSKNLFVTLNNTFLQIYLSFKFVSFYLYTVNNMELMFASLCHCSSCVCALLILSTYQQVPYSYEKPLPHWLWIERVHPSTSLGQVPTWLICRCTQQQTNRKTYMPFTASKIEQPHAWISLLLDKNYTWMKCRQRSGEEIAHYGF